MSDDSEIDFLLEMAKHQKTVCTTVNDGTVIILDRKLLEGLIEKAISNKSDQVVIFVKKPDDSTSVQN